MSRKPPKLFPIEDKVSTTPSEKKVPECMPPLKQGASVATNSSSLNKSQGSSLMLRRSAPTRNFLNCNGTNSRRRFPGSSTSAATSTFRSILSPKSSSDPVPTNTNGCGNEETSTTTPTVPVNKVNGTISNGISTTNSTEPSKSFKRSRSVAVEEEDSVTSDSQPETQTSSINGKKVESSNSQRSSVSSITNSQNNNSTSIITKRTSRFSQSGNFNVVSSARKVTTASNVSVSSSSSSNLSPPPPPLVAYNEKLSETITKVQPHPTDSSDSEPLPTPVPDETIDLEEREEELATLNEPISEEPIIIRKGDTVIKSYVDEKTGRIVVFEKGMKLEVCDFGSGKWYPAKVKNVDWTKQEILVHYSNWASRFDEWISMKSNRVRPSEDTNVVTLQFAVGERVEAVWPMDSRRYLGTIISTLSNDMYDVKFDDGIKMKRSSNQLFKVSQTEALPAPAVNIKEVNQVEPKKEIPKSPPLLPVKRRSIKSGSVIRSSIASDEAAATPTPPENETTTATDSVDTHSQSTPVISTPGTSRRQAHVHFSVFDLPQGDLGKRRRTIKDYSLLVKGQTRGPRRPKSEGNTSAGLNSSAPTTDDECAGPPMMEMELALPAPSPETPEPIVNVPVPSKRRKSGILTPNQNKVPSSQSSPNESISKELPAASAPTEVVPTPEPMEKVETTIPQKKRRQPSSTSSSALATSVIPTTAEPKTGSQLKKLVDTSGQSVDSAVKSTIITSSVVPPPPPAPTPTISRRPRSVGSVQALALIPPPAAEVPKDTKVDSGFVDESGNPIIIEQNEVDGFWKCPLNKCGKNFRKDSLLKMHFKHYHPELKVTRVVANVVQMAQARTAYENEHHVVWPKTFPEQPSTRESSPVGKASGDMISTPDLQDPHLPSHHKRGLKSTPPIPLKAVSPVEKVSPLGTLKSEVNATSSSSPSKYGSAEGTTAETPDTSLALTQSPRLRMSRKRNLVWTKFGRIRRSELLSKSRSPRKKHTQTSEKNENRDRVAIDTSGIKKIKVAESIVDSPLVSANEVDVKREIESPAASLSCENTLSPSIISDPKSEFSIDTCSGSSSNEPYLVPPYGEAEPLVHGRPRGRWSKSHIRRGLMNSNMRRVGSGMVPSLLKKRLGNYRKFIGKRSRQKQTSILSRISSGRMRVILESLNQRSLMKKRFLATRRGRDVKVDVINCICSNKTEFGLMIQCELCLCWQHGSCFNVQTTSQLPDYYACQSCSEPEKARVSKKFEWAESEFYKLGKMSSFPFGPSFPKDDARILKMCTNLTSNLAESYQLIKSLKLKERICFGQPEHPQLYQWNTERSPPQEEIQRDKFEKCFQPVLRRLLLENKSDSTYPEKLRKLAEQRFKLRTFSETVMTAKATMKKKLGCRATAFLDYICESVLDEMIKHRKKILSEETSGVANGKKEVATEVKKRSAEIAYHRLIKVRDDVMKKQRMTEQRSVNLVLGPTSYTSPLKSNPHLHSPLNSITKSTQDSVINGANLLFPMKGSSSSSAQLSNGLQKDVSSNIKDFTLLRKYLKERRTLESNISLTLTRMSKEFPDDWKNLMKLSRQFVDEASKDSSSEVERTKWVATVIITYNNLRILLRQIYSEVNTQKQKNYATEFEKATRKLFDLFGIGLTEEHEEKKTSNPRRKLKRIRGLETLDFVQNQNPNLDLLRIDSEEETGADGAGKSKNSNNPVSVIQNQETVVVPDPTLVQSNPSLDLLKARTLDGHMVLDFTNSVSLLEAVEIAGDIPNEESSEENVDLKVPEETGLSDQDPTFTGIIPVPAASRITPDVCRKNLVRDILLQQQQIDLYLDKIEGQILKLASQSKVGGVVTSPKAVDISTQRDRMLSGLDLVNRLTKTMIGENDIVPCSTVEDVDMSETTVTDDSSELDSSDSDDDNTSNYSGTDTETADEGDFSGDDDLLDV